MELAGISKFNIQENVPGTEGYYGMEDTVEWDSEVEGFNSLLRQAEESDEDVDSAEDINAINNENLPDKFFKGVYAGENMMESINYIEELNENDLIYLPDIF